MTGRGESSSDEALLDLLERCFLVIESGEEPDIDEICGHDAALADRLRSMIEREREWSAGLDLAVTHDGVPDRLGRYELLSEIGRGGMSTVYLARDTQLDREVALKVLRAPVGSDDPLRTRFRREAEITAALEHPNIVPIHEVGEEAGYLYLVMKCLTGPNLAAAGRLPPREVARVGAKLCRALHEAHLSGVIHRDVKPSNVLLDGGEPVLLDFGLAFGLGDVRLTQTGTAAGTVLYMSPEQVAGRVTALDPRTDIYSLGATLYESAEGRPTIPREASLPEIMRRIELHDPPPAEHLRRDADLDTILRRALQKDRERRFDTALAMAEDLERFLRGEPIVSARSSITSRLILLSRRHRAASLLAVVLGAVIVVLGLALWANRYGQRRVFEADLARARAVLVTDGDTTQVRRLLESLRSRGGGRDVAELERECEAVAAFDRFFDVVHEVKSTRSIYDASELRTSMYEFEASGATDVRRPWSDCVHALAYLHLDDAESARARLAAAEEVRGTRAVAALRALVDGDGPAEAAARTPQVAVADLAPLDLADDHVLVATALRLSGASPAAIRGEIDKAMAVRRDHYRAREALALLERSEGNHGKALGLFLGLVTPEGYRPMILLHQAYQALLLGDLELAERSLHQVPEGERNARHSQAMSQLLRRRGELEEALVVARDATERWPGDGPLRLETGQVELLLGRRDLAMESLRAAIGLASRPRVRERAAGVLATCEFQELHEEALRGEDVGAELAARLSEWEVQADRTSDRVARSDLLLVIARSRRMFGQHDAARAELDRAIEVDPDNHTARTTFSLWTMEQAVNERLDGEVSPEVAAAMRRAGRYTEEITTGSLPVGSRELTDQCRQDAWYTAFLLAWCRADDAALDDAYHRLRTHAPHYWQTQRDWIDRMVEHRIE